jgi:hypothetical protein
MNRIFFALALVLVAAPVFAQEYAGDDEYSYADQQQGPTLDDFQQDGELSWNGEWIDTPEYGRVWRPTRVGDQWQPYMYGRWVATDAGWAWVSDEPFGWAVYHYGRWAFSPDVGWFWVPGRVWAPAWVVWSWGGGYAGWCPLGPGGHVYRRPERWVYVSQQHFLEPVRRVVVPIPRHVDVPMRGAGPRAAPPVSIVERATGQTVRPMPVREAATPHATAPAQGSFYRPHTAPVQPRPQVQQPQRPPTYFGGVPGPRSGGQPRPQPRPQGEVAPQPRPQGQAAPQPRPQGQVAPAPQKTQPHAVTPKPSSNSGQAQPKER